MRAPTVKYGFFVSLISREPKALPVKTSLPVGAEPAGALACMVRITPGAVCVKFRFSGHTSAAYDALDGSSIVACAPTSAVAR